MLKTPESRILLLLLIAVCVAWVVMPERGVKRDLKQKDKELLQAQDSIRILQKAQSDSTEYHLNREKILIETTRKAEAEKAIATRQTQIIKRKYESIKFVNYRSNSKRDSILSTLYPSYDSIR